MNAIILAAGMGSRLKTLTQGNTKAMIKVNGVTLIERMLRQLDKVNLSQIIIVVGYEGKKLIDYIGTLNIKTPIQYIDNPIYDKTNNIYSLSLAKDFLLQEDTLLLESDLIFEDSILQDIIDDKRETLALVDKYESWMDGTVATLDNDDNIQAFLSKNKFIFEDIPHYYKTVNIYKFSCNFSTTHYVPFLEAYLKALGNNKYYEQVLQVIAMLDESTIKAKRINGQLWYEIDDLQDLDIASSMFNPDEDDKLRMMQSRYGGYWRYPKLLDFCYLVNPYFPPQKLMDEIKANFETLLTQYPSGMNVNSLLAAKNFDISQEQIVVGNGAAELIKCLMENLRGNVGFIRPTFEEYPNRYPLCNQVIYTPNTDDLSYTAKDLIDYFNDKNLTTLLLINPDNPSGNYIPKQEVLMLIKWCKLNDIKIIVDESFVDFSEEKDSTLIVQNIINEYENLIIVKSISKSYGVPGIRLGILVSADLNLLTLLKKEVSIWNINSFGEFYMQITEKYKNDYSKGLEKLRETRKTFTKALNEIKGVKVIPSQANYIMVELTDGMKSYDLTRQLLINKQILVKDLTPKLNLDDKQFIRVAVKLPQENNCLVKAFIEYLSK